MHIDLTQTIAEDMPVYPGTERPILDRTLNIKDYGFAETKMTMFSHTGTHLDAPSHMVEGGRNLDDYPVSHFFGKAFLLDLSTDEDGNVHYAAEGLEVLKGVESLDDIESVDCIDHMKKALSVVGPVDFLVLRTGWSSRWGTDSYFHDFPIPSKEVLKVFLEHGIKGIGIDAISVDPVGSTEFENHMLIFAHEVIIMENLCNLDRIRTNTFEITLLPLKMVASDGMSARVVAKVME